MWLPFPLSLYLPQILSPLQLSFHLYPDPCIILKLHIRGQPWGESVRYLSFNLQLTCQERNMESKKGVFEISLNQNYLFWYLIEVFIVIYLFVTSVHGMKVNLRLACSSPKSCSSAVLSEKTLELRLERGWATGCDNLYSLYSPYSFYSFHSFYLLVHPLPVLVPSEQLIPAVRGQPHILCLPWTAIPTVKIFFLICSLILGELFHLTDIILEPPAQKRHSCHSCLVLLVFQCATFFESWDLKIFLLEVLNLLSLPETQNHLEGCWMQSVKEEGPKLQVSG